MQQSCKLLLHVEQHLQNTLCARVSECACTTHCHGTATSSVCTERKLSQQYCLTAPQPVLLCLSQPCSDVGRGREGGGEGEGGADGAELETVPR